MHEAAAEVPQLPEHTHKRPRSVGTQSDPRGPRRAVDRRLVDEVRAQAQRSHSEVDARAGEAHGRLGLEAEEPRDRRAGGRPLVRFVFQRNLESVLYGRSVRRLKWANLEAAQCDRHGRYGTASEQSVCHQ